MTEAQIRKVIGEARCELLDWQVARLGFGPQINDRYNDLRVLVTLQVCAMSTDRAIREAAHRAWYAALTCVWRDTVPDGYGGWLPMAEPLKYYTWTFKVSGEP
jgi:hypothetical protein